MILPQEYLTNRIEFGIFNTDQLLRGTLAERQLHPAVDRTPREGLQGFESSTFHYGRVAERLKAAAVPVHRKFASCLFRWLWHRGRAAQGVELQIQSSTVRIRPVSSGLMVVIVQWSSTRACGTRDADSSHLCW